MDATLCPLCGRPNRCAMEVEKATGVPQADCWCTQVDFSAGLLASVPQEAVRRACVCAQCAGGDAKAQAPTPTCTPETLPRSGGR